MTDWIATLGQNLRYAARGMGKSPAFTIVAVLTLAVGIGGTTTIFTAIDALFLRPLPYPDQDRLVALSNRFTEFPRGRGPVSGTDVAHWRADNQVFEQIEFVSGPDMVAMSTAGFAERVGVQHVSVRLFSLLGVKAFLGNIPTDPVSEKKGLDGVAISYEFWQHHYGGDPNVLGSSIFVDTAPSTVIAVLNPGFNLFGTGVPEAYFIHGMANPAESGFDDPRFMLSIAKLKPGVSLQQAQAAMNVTQLHLAQVFPEVYKGVGVGVEPLQKGLFGWSEQDLYLLLVAVGFVLLIACANVANLLLVRGEGRRKEIGVRVALGASRKRLIGQLLTENVLLSLFGGVLGLVLSFGGVRILYVLAPREFPRTSSSFVDGRVLLFTLGICVLTGLVFGMIPAYRASKNDVNEFLREGGRSTATRSRHRTRNIIVVAEIAVALVSLICAGLMINTLTRILRISPGFNPDHLLAAEVRLTGEKYMDATQQDKTGLNVIHPSVGIFCRHALERVGSIPGVESVALVDWLPLSKNAEPAFPSFIVTGRPAPPRAERPSVLLAGVSATYFGLVGIPILRGRGITEHDTETAAPVVVIDQTIARQFWPNEDPLGQTITFDSSPEERPRQIVGIVGSVKQFGLARESEPEAYVSIAQLPSHTAPGWTESRVHKTIVLRTRSATPALIQSVRTTLSELAPDSPVFGLTMVDKMVSDSAQSWRSLSQLLGIFAGVALLLAAMGIYGVISYSVGERSHELGLRMALGAQQKQVVQLVLSQAMRLSIVGVIVGGGASFAAAPLLAEFLYGVKPHDVLTLALVSLVLLVVTFVASYLPAQRATKIDPMETLRHE